MFARHIIPKSKAKTLEDEAKLPFRKLCFVPRSNFIVVYFVHCVKSCTCKVVPDSKSMRHIAQPLLERLKHFVHPVIFTFDTTIARFMNRDIRCDR